MNFCEFAEDFDCAPLDEIEFAQHAGTVIDAPDLAQSAHAFLNARNVFLSTLAKYDIEIG